MVWIILLIVLGIVLYITELIFSGITIAAIGSVCAFAAGISWAYMEYGAGTGSIVLLVSVVSALIVTAIFLRPKTWHKVALKAEIKDSVSDSIDSLVALGAEGVAITRLAPMGTVKIDGKLYEAKSLGSYIDPQSEIVVTGYENANLIVKLK